MSDHMRQAIVTKYHCSTNMRGPRISATTGSGIRNYYSWQYDLDGESNHASAAQKMAEHMGWDGTWRGGAIPGGYAFVLNDGALFTIAPDTNR